MLRFPDPPKTFIHRAIETLRLLAGIDTDGTARPLLTSTTGALQVEIVSTRQVYYLFYGGNLAVYTGGVRMYNTTGRTLTFEKVHISVNTAPAGAGIIVDLNKNGTSIFASASRPQIAAGAYTGYSTTFNATTFADGDYLTFDIDQVGSSTPGANLTVQTILS